ncbi:retrovirus-related pol polyprotein from transposon TNT 1-94 [Tanacetum coccineum]
MDLCGPMSFESINGKRYVLVIVDDYSSYTWVYFLKSKDEALEVIKTFLKKNIVLLQAPVIIVRTDNGAEFKNHVLKEYFDSIGISHQALAVRTPHRVMERRNRTLVEAARTMLIFFCTFKTQDSRHDFWKNQFRTRSYLCSLIITSQKPTEPDLDLLFEAMYDDYIGGQPSAAIRTSPAAQSHQVLQTPVATTTTADTAPTLTNSSSQAADIPNSTQDVDELEPQPQHAQ